MRALHRKLLFLFLILPATPLSGCVGLFYPSISGDYSRALQMYEAGGPYDKVIRACAEGREDVAAFARRCPEGSACRQKENPGDLSGFTSGYDYLQAASYFKLGELQKAHDLAAMPEYEYQTPMRNLLASIHLARGENEKAAREYFYLLLLGDTDGAPQLLPPLEASLDRQALNHQTPHLLNLRAARFARNNDTQKALRDYGDSISADPLQIHAYLERARIYAAAGTPGKALLELNMAIAIRRGKKAYSDARMDDLQIPIMHFDRGRLRLEMSNADGAMADFAIVARKSRDPRQVARVNFEIGQIHESMDKLDLAIDAYKKAADVPDYGDPWYRMAVCYAQKSMPKESKEALVALARIDQEKSDALARSLKELNLLE
jgi:tetratricopeptide (TPR) repeat protein